MFQKHIPISISIILLTVGCSDEVDYEHSQAEAISLENNRSALSFVPFNLERYQNEILSDKWSDDLLEVPMTEWPREVLAEQLRVVSLNANGSYISEGPNWQAADHFLNNDQEIYISNNTSIQAENEEADSSIQKQIIGSDGRTYITNSSVYPYNAVASISNSRGGLCTASFIGARTLLTSAHCVVNQQTGERLAQRITINRGRNGSTVLARAVCRNDDTSTSNDFGLFVPAAYFNNDRHRHLDYAVIDISDCTSSPVAFAGIVQNSGDAHYYHVGYPGKERRCPGAPGVNDYPCRDSGSGYRSDYRLESGNIDTVDGHSGGPWWVNRDGRLYVAGIHSGKWDFFDLTCSLTVCKRNAARRIDGAVSYFIELASKDFGSFIGDTSNPIYQIRNAASNKCAELDTNNGVAFENAANIRQFFCVNYNYQFRWLYHAQTWEFLPNGQIRNRLSGKCWELDINNGANIDGANIRQWDCVGPNHPHPDLYEAQRWERLPSGQIRNRLSRKCAELDTNNGGTNIDGSNIRQFFCVGENYQYPALYQAQRWFLDRQN